MRISLLLWFILLCFAAAVHATAQQKNTTLIRSHLEDESIDIAVDRPIYFPGDTVRLTLRRADSMATASVSPVSTLEGMKLKSDGHGTYIGIIPKNVTPGSYPILLRIVEVTGQRFVYDTGRMVAIEEHQAVEQLSRYAGIVPFSGSDDPQAAVTLDRGQMRALQVVFQRDSIRSQMGPQFVTITTLVQLRDGSIAQTFERRVVTFRTHGNPERDRAMFNQYRTAYGVYAAISMKDLDRVRLPLDSLPAWANVRVKIEPDYGLTAGAADPSNSVTAYFRVRGPAIEIGFSLGIPKVLYDTRAKDSVVYGNTSAMVRFYFVSWESGNRFPVSLGIGTFGVNSPIDVDVGRGGFVVPVFLDLVELVRTCDIELSRRINLGLELTPFFSIGRKPRLLFDAQVSLTL